MAKNKTTTDLMALDAQCINLVGTLGAAVRHIDTMSEVGAARELAIVKTKIEESMMWLDKYHAGVCINLANRTCR